MDPQRNNCCDNRAGEAVENEACICQKVERDCYDAHHFGAHETK